MDWLLFFCFQANNCLLFLFFTITNFLLFFSAITAFLLLRRYARLDPPEASPTDENDRPIAVAGL